MNNAAEVPKENLLRGQSPENDRAGEVIDIQTRKPLTPEEVEVRKREHPSWPVTIGKNKEVIGLPPGISEKNVILFLGSDGQWWAQNPSSELLEEIRLWRTDWQDV